MSDQPEVTPVATAAWRRSHYELFVITNDRISEAQAADLQSRVLDLCDSLGIVVGSALKAVSDA